MNSNPVFSRIYLPIHATFQTKHEIHHQKSYFIAQVCIADNEMERKSHPELLRKQFLHLCFSFNTSLIGYKIYKIGCFLLV